MLIMKTVDPSNRCILKIERDSQEPCEVKAAIGTTLLECIRSLPATSMPDAVCNGTGRCGKCKIYASGNLSPLTQRERSLLTDEEIKSGIRLACQTKILGPASLKLQDRYNSMQIVTQGGKTPEALREIPEKYPPAYGLVIDIGTTTIVLYLCDLKNRKINTVKGFRNPQCAFGADVISRIHAVCRNPSLLSAQQDCLTREIIVQLDRLCGPLDISGRDLQHIVLTGNTVMLHLATGLDPRSMAAFPFIPASTFGNTYTTDVLRIPLLSKTANVYIPPCFSAFSGADIATGLLYAGMPDILDNQQTVLFLDIGTNCEIVLAHRGRLFLCSTAAGPAFEGGGLSCGMPSLAGAVDHMDTNGTAMHYTTIEGMPPAGFCGSGMIDAAVFLLQTGMLTKDGRLKSAGEARGPFRDMLESENGQNIFSPFHLKNCRITAKDIRELQTAKAAVRGAIDTLLKNCGVAAKELETVYLAGGFGSRLNPASAARIGLLPAECLPKIRTLENAAGAGAVQILLRPECTHLFEQLLSCAETLELSNTEYFSHAFIDAIDFPSE